MTERFLSRSEVASRIGVQPKTLDGYDLPAPDAVIGSTRGWRAATIDTWNLARPGQGARTDLKGTAMLKLEMTTRESGSIVTETGRQVAAVWRIDQGPYVWGVTSDLIAAPEAGPRYDAYGATAAAAFETYVAVTREQQRHLGIKD